VVLLDTRTAAALGEVGLGRTGATSLESLTTLDLRPRCIVVINASRALSGLRSCISWVDPSIAITDRLFESLAILIDFTIAYVQS
jgi:hypothetical protein